MLCLFIKNNNIYEDALSITVMFYLLFLILEFSITNNKNLKKDYNFLSIIGWR